MTVDSNLGAILETLARISRMGPVAAVSFGSKAVGMTLLSLLEVPASSRGKARLNGIVLNARRGSGLRDVNRVNLFACVPDWDISRCKSSQEILNKYGYPDGPNLKLFCSVSTRQPNSQGLILNVEASRNLIHEICVSSGSAEAVATWRIPTLTDRLMRSHPETIWVTAVSHIKDGKEFFHYRYAMHTRAPQPEILAPLIHSGTVTVDHLISNAKGRTVEKGPLFKIRPSNVQALFGEASRYDLLDV